MDVSPAKRSYFTCANVWWKLLFHSTVDEWEQYELHHRSRMSIKPGITGMWQASGRSDITDFEEVVKLDTEYIENWSIGLDCRILLKTVRSVVKSEGSV